LRSVGEIQVIHIHIRFVSVSYLSVEGGEGTVYCLLQLLV